MPLAVELARSAGDNARAKREQQMKTLVELSVELIVAVVAV